MNFLRRNQPKFRHDIRSSIHDALLKNSVGPNRLNIASKIGLSSILPSSHVGGDRFMNQVFQDLMSYVVHFDPPSYFVTVTANVNWNEIRAELVPGQDVRDRADLVDRVFGLKLDDLLGDLTVNGVLCKCRAVASVIEYQKRGNIHCHIVLWTEIPDPVAEPDLHALVTGNIMQGSCSPQENKPCMRLGKDGKYRCRFGIPRHQCNLTSLDPRSGYPIFRRRCLHQTVKKNRPLSDQWVATYSPFLLLKIPRPHKRRGLLQRQHRQVHHQIHQ